MKREPSFARHDESEVGELSFQPSSQRGEVLGDRYKVLGYLSEGATSRVYVAEDATGEHGRVVVKMLSPEAGTNVEFRQRMLREAQTVRPIVHPNVVRVLDVNDGGGGLPFVVMEALPGEPLGDRLRRQGPLPSERVLTLGVQIAAGLLAVHRAGVVHRDLKPDNLFLIERPGQPDQIKILDFGMAKLLSGGRSSAPQTVLGTAAYMAPEQILVEGIDPRSDIYSLGVVLFRMLTGHLPFDTSVPADLLRHQLFSPIPPPSWLLEGIDPGLEAIVLNATRKDPENRYTSVEEVIDDLGALAEKSRDVTLRVLKRSPDRYQPTTHHGQQAVAVLAPRFGAYADPTELRSRTRETSND